MLMQYLPPEERKGESKYRHGDWIMFDDKPTEEQQRKVLESAEKWGYAVSTCVVCGRYTKGRRAYCSDRCRNDAYMERRRQRHEANLRKTCETCGKPFTAKRADARYCSPACKQSAYRKRVTANRSAEFSTTDSGNVTANRSGHMDTTDSGNGNCTE